MKWANDRRLTKRMYRGGIDEVIWRSSIEIKWREGVKEFVEQRELSFHESERRAKNSSE